MFNASDLPARRKTWMNIAAIPKNRLGWEFSDCDEVDSTQLNIIQGWVQQAKAGSVIRAEGKKSCGVGLLLYGQPGHGKTTLGLVTIQEIIRTFMPEDFVPNSGTSIVRPCYFISFIGLLKLKGDLMGDPTPDEVSLFEGIMGDCKLDAYNVRVLVIDDVGKEHTTGSGWQRTVLHDVLRARFNNGLPTIITSNISLDEWKHVYGDSAESFAREAFVTIALKSPKGDLRK